MPAPVKLIQGVAPTSVRGVAYDKLSPPMPKVGSALLQEEGKLVLLSVTANPVSDQGSVGSCVANAICDALESVALLQGRPHVNLSRLALYYWSRVLEQRWSSVDEGELLDEGTTIPSALHQARTVGVIPESQWPYVVGRENKAPSNDEIEMAAENRVHSFQRVAGVCSPEDIPGELTAELECGHPLVFWMRLGRDYRTVAPGQVVRPPKDNWGLHAQIICGVRESLNGRQFLVRNSWGVDWGEGGYAWVDGSYMKDPTLTGDFFSFYIGDRP